MAPDDAERLIASLRDRGETLATAESCTGGLVASLLTDVPGASDVFSQGWVVYADRAKTDELGVPGELISTEGAVSGPVARRMAAGAAAEAETDWAVATTGYAGPSGGTDEVPVGTAFVAVARDGEPAERLPVERVHGSGSRVEVKRGFARAAVRQVLFRVREAAGRPG